MNLHRECLVCGKPLEYFETAKEMECAFCHEKFMSNAACEDGHYVCDKCHAEKALSAIKSIALETKSRNPYEISHEMMKNPFVHMHGNEHHILVGSALLAAFKNSGGKIDLPSALDEMRRRGSQVPGGACGLWGACGAAVSSGMFISIVTGSTPLKDKEYALSNKMTSESLLNIALTGGPRCCKRNTYTAIKTAVDFSYIELGVKMEMPNQRIICDFYTRNKQCQGVRCPYFPVEKPERAAI